MSLCINPNCPKPENPHNSNNRHCQSCGSELLLEGRYRVTQLLSDKSGFGKIYIAEEQGNAKILKVLKEHLNKNAKAVELFQKEAKVLAQLKHPGIPEVDRYFQYQTKNGLILHCIVMEKIEGLNLEEWLKQQGNHPISEQQAISWLKQLTEILHLVHEKQYFHRDIKPANIMLKRDGQLVLIDFGTAREATYTYLAKLGAGNQITAVVSAGYTPAEQMNFQAVPQSDFFALGRTFVHLLTGQHPLKFYDAHNDVFRWRDGASISPILADFIDDLMAQKPGDRPENTQVILQRIKELTQKLGKRKSNLPVVGVAASLLLVLGVGIGFLVSKIGGSSVSPVVSSSPSISNSKSVDYPQLENFLKSENWQAADAETRNVMLKVANREKDGWLDVQSIDKFPCEELDKINQLWVKYSQGKFGFSVQESIWKSVGGSSKPTNEVYNRFGDRVGWRVNQLWLKYDDYNFTKNAPSGHLPVMFNDNKLPSNRLSVLAPKVAKCGIR